MYRLRMDRGRRNERGERWTSCTGIKSFARLGKSPGAHCSSYLAPINPLLTSLPPSHIGGGPKPWALIARQKVSRSSHHIGTELSAATQNQQLPSLTGTQVVIPPNLPVRSATPFLDQA